MGGMVEKSWRFQMSEQKERVGVLFFPSLCMQNEKAEEMSRFEGVDLACWLCRCERY